MRRRVLCPRVWALIVPTPPTQPIKPPRAASAPCEYSTCSVLQHSDPAAPTTMQRSFSCRCAGVRKLYAPRVMAAIARSVAVSCAAATVEGTLDAVHVRHPDHCHCSALQPPQLRPRLLHSPTGRLCDRGRAGQLPRAGTSVRNVVRERRADLCGHRLVTAVQHHLR